MEKVVKAEQAPNNTNDFFDWAKSLLISKIYPIDQIPGKAKETLVGFSYDIITLYARPNQPYDDFKLLERFATSLRLVKKGNFKQISELCKALILRAIRNELEILNDASGLSYIFELYKAVDEFDTLSNSFKFITSEVDPTKHFMGGYKRGLEESIGSDFKSMEILNHQFTETLLEQCFDEIINQLPRFYSHIISEQKYIEQRIKTNKRTKLLLIFEQKLKDLKIFETYLYPFSNDEELSLEVYGNKSELKDQIKDLLIKTLEFVDSQSEAELYRQSFIKKRSGKGLRKILEPQPCLRFLQDIIKNLFEKTLPVPHEASYGFVPKRNAKEHATVHLRAKQILTVDIASFFDSIDIEPLLDKAKISILTEEFNLSSIHRALWLATTPLAIKVHPKQFNGLYKRTKLTVQVSIIGFIIQFTNIITGQDKISFQSFSSWIDLKQHQRFNHLSSGRCFLIWFILALKHNSKIQHDLQSWKPEYFDVLIYLLLKIDTQKTQGPLSEQICTIDNWMIDEEQSISDEQACQALTTMSRKLVIEQTANMLGISKVLRLSGDRLNSLHKLMTYSDPFTLHSSSRRFQVSRSLPQGSPVSPILSNFFMQSLDKSLSELASKYQIKYSRYADDLAFSGEYIPKSFINKVNRLINSSSLRVNRRKIRFSHSGQRQEITGVIVNEKTGPARYSRANIRAMIHTIRSGRIPYLLIDSKKKMLSPKEALGHLTYWHSLDPTLVPTDLLKFLKQKNLKWAKEVQ